ncbi:MAG: hypothetical protein LLF76_02460 [Planctomycetaceae bacterium]|nr:hypothetical protein [Planctomycetaceae bacterium]
MKYKLYGSGLVVLIVVSLIGYALMRPADPAFPPLLFAGDILRLGRQIADILDNIETVEQAKEAITSLEPLGLEYRKLNINFQKHYLQDGGPTFSKLGNQPEDVQYGALFIIGLKQNLEDDALYELSGKNLPSETKGALIDSSTFVPSFAVLASDKSHFEDYVRRLNAPYTPVGANTSPEPNRPADPNELALAFCSF